MRVCDVCKRCYSDDVTSCIDATHLALRESSVSDPEMIVGYRIEFLLSKTEAVGRFRAKHVASNRECIISVISPNSADLQTFLDQANTASSIISPAVANIYEFGTFENGEAYLISEFSDKRSLRDLLRDSGVPQLLTSIQIVRQTAEAVDVLHSNGSVHGAIRPENILLISEMSGPIQVKIQNPDLAGVNRNSIIANKFTIDSAIDTIHYFAPEQFLSEPNSPLSDIYSLGTVLYELLSGSPPFAAENAAELIEKQQNEHPPEVSIGNFDLRMLLANTLMESLQKQPGLRLPSALAFARQMRHIEQLATHSSTPPPVMSVPTVKVRSAAASASVQDQRSVDAKVKEIPAPTTKVASIEAKAETGSQFVKQEKPVLAAPPEKKSNTVAVSGAGVEELNRFRLKYWKEKYDQQFAKPVAAKATRWDSILNLEPPEKLLGAKTASPPRVVSEKQVVEEKRIKIERHQPDADVPTIEDVRKARAKESVKSGSPPEKAIASPISICAPERDTQISRPARSSKRQHPRTLASALFSSFDEAPEPKSSEPTSYRASNFYLEKVAAYSQSIDRRILAGGFVILAVFALFVAGSFFTGDEVRYAADESRPPIQAAEQGQRFEVRPQLPPQSNDVVIESATIKADRYEGEPVSERKREMVKDTKPFPDTKTVAIVTRSTNQSPAKVAADLVSGPVVSPLGPSTLVIYSDKGKVNKRLETTDNTRPPRSSAKPATGNGATRPRIVANPKP